MTSLNCCAHVWPRPQVSNLLMRGVCKQGIGWVTGNSLDRLIQVATY